MTLMAGFDFYLTFFQAMATLTGLPKQIEHIVKRGPLKTATQKQDGTTLIIPPDKNEKAASSTEKQLLTTTASADNSATINTTDPVSSTTDVSTQGPAPILSNAAAFSNNKEVSTTKETLRDHHQGNNESSTVSSITAEEAARRSAATEEAAKEKTRQEWRQLFSQELQRQTQHAVEKVQQRFQEVKQSEQERRAREQQTGGQPLINGGMNKPRHEEHSDELGTDEGQHHLVQENEEQIDLMVEMRMLPYEIGNMAELMAKASLEPIPEEEILAMTDDVVKHSKQRVDLACAAIREIPAHVQNSAMMNAIMNAKITKAHQIHKDSKDPTVGARARARGTPTLASSGNSLGWHQWTDAKVGGKILCG